MPRARVAADQTERSNGVAARPPARATPTPAWVAWALPAIVLAITAAAFGRNLGTPLFGSDTWPWIASSQVHSPQDVVHLLFSPIMPGTQFEAQIAHFYHPLTALSYVLNVTLFGLNPLAYYATDLLLHLVAVGALYSLARGLGLAPWASAITALVFGLHPIAEATVPVIPRRQDLVVGACFVSSMTLLVRANLGSRQPRRGVIAGALVLYALALGGKEIAYAGLPLVPFALLCAPRTVPLGDRRLLRRTLAVCACFLAVEIVGFAIRWRVLGGLGGYFGSEANRGNLSGVLEFFLRPYVDAVLWPIHAVLPDRLRDWLTVVLVGLVVAVLAAARLRRQLLSIVLFGLVWQASFLALYIAAHNPLDAYLLYVPLAGFALVLGALLEGGWRWLVAIRTRGRVLTGQGAQNHVRDLALLVAAVAGACFVLATLWVSPLRAGYREFPDAGYVSDRFLAAALPCLASAQGTAQIEGLPNRIDYGTAESRFVDAFVFDNYSMESVLRLFAPGAPVTAQVNSLSDVHAPPSAVRVSCDGDPQHRDLVVSYGP